MLSQRIATNIERDDTVVVYPTYGHLVRGMREWHISLMGTVYDCREACRRKRLWLSLFQRLNKFHPNEEQRAMFERRVHAFVAATRRGKRVVVRIGDQTFDLEKATKRDGFFTGTLRLPAAIAKQLERSGQLAEGWLDLGVVLPDGEPSGFHGRVRLLDDVGVSVISDIDDTMKVTNVTCLRSLLENTFLREFEAVDGVAEVYRRWASQGAAFHYVSSSPWQLFAPMAEFFDRAGFPAGTFHLRSFRLHDPMLRRLWLLRRRAKAAALKSLLLTFPGRRFVLVGDSGDRDPEIYGALARRFGSQIGAIFIRELPQQPMSAQRCHKSFGRGDDSRWRLFRDARELPHGPEPERCSS